MLTQEQEIILGKLGYYVAFLASALPARLTARFCELLVVSMVTSEGFVTQSWIWGKLHNFWGSCHKWLETGRWQTYHIVARFMQLCCLGIPETQPLFLAIDDTFVLRFSEKAPGCAIAYQHAHKLNQARYVLGQCFVYMSLICERPTDEVPTAIPWLARMAAGSGNTSKLFTAKTLLRLTHAVIGERMAYLLYDCWYMRGSVIQYTLKPGRFNCLADFFLHFHYGQGSKAQVSFQCANNYKTPDREVSKSRLPLTRAIDADSTLVGGFHPVVLTLYV